MTQKDVGFRRVDSPGENIWNRLGHSALSYASLSRSLGLSRPLLRYHVMEATGAVLEALSADLRRRSVALLLLADEIDRISAGE